MMDVLLKVRTKTREHTFQEDVYTCTLKYRRWNNQLRPFRSLKKRVANIFKKRNSMSDGSRGTYSQSIINNMERDSEERSVVSDNKQNSIHSDLSDLIPIDVEAEYWRVYNSRKRPDARVHISAPLAAPVAKAAAVPPSSPATHRTIKNIVLVPFTLVILCYCAVVLSINIYIRKGIGSVINILCIIHNTTSVSKEQ